MNKFKQFIAGLIVGAMLLSTITVFAGAKTIEAFYNNIKISIEGKAVELKDATGNTVEPFIYNGTTYLPVRAIAEALGMEVKFNETTNTVELAKKEGGKVNWSDSNTGIISEGITSYEDYLMIDTWKDGTKYIYPGSIVKQFNLKDGKDILTQSTHIKLVINKDTETVSYILKKAGEEELILLENIPTNNQLGTYLIPYDTYKNEILPKLLEGVSAQ
jgi:hypothetical protein